MTIDINGNEKSFTQKRTLLRIIWVVCVLFGLAGLAVSPWWAYLLILGFLALMFINLRQAETGSSPANHTA